MIYKLNASDYSLLTYDSNYDAFGNGGNRSYSNLGYCGEYFDNESGLIYLRARYYNPKTGRFINEDPIRDGLNWYVYCENNPVKFVDPSGLVVTEWDMMHCSYDEINQLRRNTKKWENGSGVEKAEAAASSKAIREKYLESGESLCDDGTVFSLSIDTLSVPLDDNNIPVRAAVDIQYTREYKKDHTIITLKRVAVRSYLDKGYHIQRMEIYAGEAGFPKSYSYEDINYTREYSANFGFPKGIYDDKGAHCLIGASVYIYTINDSGKMDLLIINKHVYSESYEFNGKIITEPDLEAAYHETIQYSSR